MEEKKLFTEIYKKNIWNGKESKSGPGSDYENTKYLIPELSRFIDDYDIKSMLDIPCGDFNWMKRVSLNNVAYTGGDIVDDLIASNQSKYQKANIKFKVLDILNNKLPKVDLMLVRDCFVHLTTEDIQKALMNIKDSKSKYLLSTSFTWRHMDSNKKIKTGGWRRINLEDKPFSLPKPITYLVEGEPLYHRDKSLGLWLIKDIPDYLNKL
jgi:SAM-dependent methyltransferase